MMLFAHAQGDLNLLILRMLEGTLSLDTAHIYITMGKHYLILRQFFSVRQPLRRYGDNGRGSGRGGGLSDRMRSIGREGNGRYLEDQRTDEENITSVLVESCLHDTFERISELLKSN